MFNLGATNLEDIPDGFKVGSYIYPVMVTKAEEQIPRSAKDDESPEFFAHKRNLKISLQVDDETNPYYEMQAQMTIVFYEFENEEFQELSRDEQAKVTRALNFFRSRMKEFGFSDDEINNNEVTPADIAGLQLNAKIARATEGAWAQVVEVKRRDSVLGDDDE